MKIFTLAIATLMFTTTANANHSNELMLDTSESSATWIGKKVTEDHTGSVSFKDGEFKMKNGKLVGGEVEIDLTSIKNSDVKDPDYNKKLVEHLQSPDFFDTAKYPIAKFKIKSLHEVHNFVPGQPNAEVIGDLTIRGITKPFIAKVFYTPNKNGFEAKGKLSIDRTKYGLKYNSKKFFDAKKLGDKLINDIFELDFKLVTKK